MYTISITTKLHCLLIICFFVCAPFLAASTDRLLSLPEHTKDSAQSDIFEQFKTTPFADDAILDLLVKTPNGRKNLIYTRIGELIRERFINSCNSEVKTIVSSTFSFPVSGCAMYQKAIKAWQPYEGTNNLMILSNGIANIESALIEWDTLSCYTQQQFESTRVHDLYLLKMILENDNCEIQKETDLSLLPIFLEKNKENWPPKHSANVLHPTSGYQVIVAALAKRRINKTDEIDESNRSEVWTWVGVESPKNSVFSSKFELQTSNVVENKKIKNLSAIIK